MLTEAINRLFQLGKDSTDLIVRTKAEPEHIYFIRKADGTLDKQSAERGPRAETAFSLQAILETCQDATANVWYGPEAVNCEFGEEMRNRMVLALVESEQMKHLRNWATTGAAMQQPALIRHLRVTFRDCLELAGQLAENIKRVRFQTGQKIDSEVGHGKISVGKEIQGDVTGVQIIPEYITFVVPVFANPCFAGLRANIECALEPDPMQGNFKVSPLPGQIEYAVARAMDGIEDMIRNGVPKAVKVYYGKPDADDV